MRLLVLACCVTWGASFVLATEILVAAVSDLNIAMKDIIAGLDWLSGETIPGGPSLIS